MCLLFILALFAPRLVFALMWIFGNRVDVAFGSWIWSLLLLIFLPWTGIVYTFAWTTNGLGVDGIEWLWVALAVAVDLASWSARGEATDGVLGQQQPRLGCGTWRRRA